MNSDSSKMAVAALRAAVRATDAGSALPTSRRNVLTTWVRGVLRSMNGDERAALIADDGCAAAMVSKYFDVGSADAVGIGSANAGEPAQAAGEPAQAVVEPAQAVAEPAASACGASSAGVVSANAGEPAQAAVQPAQAAGIPRRIL